MGHSPASDTHEGTIMKVFVALALISVVAGSGYIRPHCTKALEKITVKKCRLDYTEEWSTATKEVGQRISYEKGECKEIEVCKPVHFVPKYGPRRHYGKREAEASYGPHVECEKTSKEVCEDVETSVPKVTCETLKH